jgi:hypothetical protein
MKHETSLALYAYWQSRHRSAGVSVGEIRAAELAPILPALFLLDVDTSLEPRFRFCGAELALRHGRDLTDESFLTLWNADDRSALQRDLGAFAANSTGLVAGVMAETIGGGFTAFEMLLLPLAGKHGTAGAIGSMVRTGGHEELNRIRARIVAQWLRSVRFLPRTTPSGDARLPLPETIIPRRSIAKLRRSKHLTLVAGGGTRGQVPSPPTLTDI